MRPACLLFLAIAFASARLAIPSCWADSSVSTVNALALLGEPKYGADFKHFAWVNPDAPKGGELHLAAIGSFDTLNPYSFKGVAAANLGALFETLTVQNPDEADTEYGLIAQSIEVPADRSWVAFNLRPEARWQDGQPITAEDVVFTFNILTTKGDPQYALYYADVAKVEAVAPLKVKFTFKNGNNRELAQILGQLPVLPKHYWQGKNFEETTLVPPLGSGPYKIDSFEVGRYIVYRRDPNYWGDKLPVKVGVDNWGSMRFDYYKDPNVAHIAFLAGAYDYTIESSAKVWATGYDTPALKDGRLIKVVIPDHNPSGMQCFAFNLRRDIFKDRRVREALGFAFDFEWSNKTLFYGQYARTKSFFDNSELASSGLPSPEELKILEPLRGRIPDEVFTQEFKLPTTDGSGNNRANLLRASALLDSAGWIVKDGKRVNKDTSQPLTFEILLDNPLFERIALPFAQNLKRLGVEASVRTVDDAQYQQRIQTFDFDMAVGGFGASLSPGNEQRFYWGSKAADTPASPNIIGIKDPAIDALIDAVVAAPDRQQLIFRTRALDRVLLWNYFVIPHFHLGAYRLAYWNRFGIPLKPPEYAPGLDAWWIDAAKDKMLTQLGRN
jgi:microcin C transport system substrate-binding protein